VSVRRFDPKNSATDRSAVTSGLLAGIVGFVAFAFIWGLVVGLVAGLISAVVMGALAVPLYRWLDSRVE
jgi:fructose-specific phosphotransferase system IIC component